MRSGIQKIRIVFCSAALFVLTAVVLAMPTPDPGRASDLHQATSGIITVQATTTVETCHLVATCEMPALLEDSLLIAAAVLLREPAFLNHDNARTSSSPEVQLPPPRV
jgi:hypothetical protein